MGGKIAVITGAGSGIGRAVALALGAKGYKLVLAGRQIATLEETVGLAALAPGDALCVVSDVTSSASVDALFARALERFWRVDLLFNNAGMGGPQVPLLEVQESDWRTVIDTNLTGAFLCLQAAFRVMKEQTPRGGRIINNGSLSAHTPRPNSFAYAASKHGVLGLTKATAIEGRAFDIACGQIDIGNAASVMGDRMLTGVLQANGTMAPEPLMDLSHVGDAVVYMDSLPLEANILTMTVMPTRMPFVGRG